MIPNIFPKPISYYQSPHFEGERGTPVFPQLDTSSITLVGADAAFRGRVLSQLETVKFRRAGTLLGDYVMLHGGFIAIDQYGVPIKLNADPDDDWANRSIFSQLENYCDSENFIFARDQALAQWAQMQALPSIPLLAETYASANYYHFAIRFMPRVRHFADSPHSVLGMPLGHLQLPFQRDLIARCLNTRRVRPVPDMTRLRDPVLMYEPFSPDALAWLRAQIGQGARRGHRRIFISRKSSLVGRHHGGILADAAFEALLAKYGFETIDFGTGEISIAAQIALLDGAGLVLSAHGANLTNIAFAEAGIAVIEILPYYWCYFSHMQIALATGLRYFGVVCHQINQHRQMVVDADLLDATIANALLD